MTRKIFFTFCFILTSLLFVGVLQAQVISTLAGTGTGGYSGDGGAATAAKINRPYGVAIDAGGNIYIADQDNNCVRKVNTSGVINTIAGTGTAGYSGDGGAATAAKLNAPTGVAVDGSGNVYIADEKNDRVRVVNTSGTIKTFAGNGSASYSGDGGAATAAEIHSPWSVAADASGNIYITDQFNNRIRKVNTSGVISTFAGTGTAGFSGDGGAATAAMIYVPAGITVDGSGNVLFVDENNQRVRKINTSGVINTIAGNGTPTYAGDGGAATAASLYNPYGVGTDAGGNVYIADLNNNRIRVVNTSGVISTCAGKGTGGYTGDGGHATAAELYLPASVCTDLGGNVYIADYINNCVRKVSITGLPSIGGTSSICAGSTTTLTNATSGGTWSSSNTAVATVGTGGVVSGVAAGTATITYTVSGIVTTAVTVNPLPAAGTITGTAALCSGATTALTNAASGGVWSSTNTAVATVGTTGVVTGVSSGTAVISYTVTNGCGTAAAAVTATVTTAPSAGTITGTTAVCAGATTTLTNTTAGGVWTSANTSVATVGTSGVVTGAAAGTATISYTITNSCGTATATATVTTTSVPAITGTAFACPGATATLSNAASGGTWSGSNSNATVVPTTGVVTGALAGTTTITYTVSGGCYATTTFTVNPLPAGIINASPVCQGATITLSNANTGGVWTSGNTAVATIGSATGVVSGVSGGTASITYTLPTGCQISATVAVNPLPSAGTITGTGTVCAAATTSLTNTTTGGVWTSTNTAAATVGSTGVVTGVAAGTATISYTTTNSCGSTAATVVVTVTPLPVPGTISGSSAVCVGSTITMSNGSSGGVWSSSNTAVASIGSTGVVTGVSEGAVIISYTVTNGCGTLAATKVVNVDIATAAITGPTTVATGFMVVLTGTPMGGTWTTSNSAVASNVCDGEYLGVTTGTTTMTYSVTNSCGTSSASTTVTVIAPNCSAPFIYTIAGNGSKSYSGDGGAGTSAALSDPLDVAVDASGNVYVADRDNHRIRKVDVAGVITTFAGTGTAGFSGDGGAAASAKLDGPTGVGVDNTGNVYIADQNNHRIRVVNTSGTISTFAGTGTAGYTGDGGYALAATFDKPIDVSTDNSGNVYVVDFNNSAIRKINTTGIITTIAGTGISGFSGDGGAATAAQLYHPTAMDVDCDGNVYIDDENNVRIRKINLSGVITTICGIGTDGDSGDGGPATAAQLFEPYGVCVDAAGNVFIGDRANTRVRVINTSGVINAYAGTTTRGYLGDGGPALSAQLYLPYGVDVDASGNLYIADNINQRIRKVSYPVIAQITGTPTVCAGSTTTLSDATTGGGWSSGNTSVATVHSGTGVVTGVSAGTATISYTVASICNVTKTVTVYPTPSVSGTPSHVSCFGGSNGSITTSTTGGTTSYSYLWSLGGAATSSIATLSAGTYSVTVTDAHSCIAKTAVTVTQPAVLAASASVTTHVSCNGGNNGAVSVSVTGGTASYTYLWNTGATTSTVTGLTAGTYSVTVTDAKGCTASGTATVTQPSTLTAGASMTAAASCNGSTNGSVSASPTGGTTSYSYLWNTGATTSTVSGLAAGTYTVTVTDAKGCTASGTATVTQPSTLAVSASTGTNVSCNGLSDGAVTTSVTGGTTSYTYLWSNGATTSSLSGIAAGTYSVTVTDAKGCTATSSTTVTQPSVLAIAASPSAHVSCNGLSDGAVSTSTTGGTISYSYLWNTGAITSSLSSVAAGTYSVTVTDAHGCTAAGTATVTQPTALSVSASVTTNASCNGASDGAVTSSTTGGTTSYSYLWNTGATTSSVTGLAAGTYTITATDAHGCTANGTATVTQPTALTVAASTTANATCNGVSNGAVTSTVSGGTIAYSYMWSNGVTTSSVTGLAAGTYSLTVTDAHGCTATGSTTVTQPSTLAVTATVGTHVSCNGLSDGALSTSTTGGTTSYSYLWNTGATTSSLTGLAAGTYSVTVTDANGCKAYGSATVTQPSTLAVSASPSAHVSCNGLSDGAVATSVTGGTTSYTYLWNTGATTSTLTGVAAGSYSVTVTDAHGCTATGTATVTQPSALTTSASASANVSCNGLSDGAVTNSASGGTTSYSYLWNTGATTLSVSGLAAGTYSVTVTDAHGCTASGTATITQPTTLTTTAATSSNATCNGISNGAVSSSTTGGTTSYSYLWSNGVTTSSITGLAAGTYSLTVTDAHGCKATSATTVTQPSTLAVSATVGSHVSCNGLSDGAVATSTTGGTTSYSYLWNTGATTSSLTGLSAGTYSVTVTDANGCTATANATVTQPSALAISASASANVSCNGLSDGAVSTSVTGGTTSYSYLWNTGATTSSLTAVGAATYSVIVTDAHGCTASGTATVTQPATLVTAASTSSNATCNGVSNGAVTSTTTGGTTSYSYMWSNGVTTSSITGLAAGTYSLTVTDAHGCTATSSTTVTQPSALAISATVGAHVSCNGVSDGAVSTSTTGGTTSYTYLWNTGATTSSLTGLAAGTYSVTVTDANGCKATTTATVTQPSVLAVSATASSHVSCNGVSDGAVSTTTTGGTTSYTYLWNTGATTSSLSGLAAGTYTVTVTDAHSCTATNTVTVTQPATLATSVTVSAHVSCNGLSNGVVNTSTTGGTTSYAYLWNTGATTSSLSGLAAGTYSVTITDAHGCTTTGNATVTQPSTLSVTASTNSNVTCNGLSNGSVTTSTTGGTTSYSYLWTNGATTATVTGLAAGTYSVTVTDANGCTATSSTTVTQPTALTASTTTTSNVSCFGLSDGAVSSSVTGGTTSYSYLWSNGATTSSLSAVAAGTYSLTVTDANGCKAYSSSTVTQPAVLAASASTTSNVSCFGMSTGVVSAAATGGTTSYTYLWNTGGTTSSLSGLAAGTYTVTVTDAHSCTAVSTTTVTEPSALVTSASTTAYVSCFGLSDGAVTSTTSGGTSPYSYKWNTAVTTYYELGVPAGTYTMTATDAKGCTAAATTTVTEPALLVANAAMTTQVSCFGLSDGSVSATPTGGTTSYSYLWNTGATTATVTGLAAGTYSVTVTDAHGCKATGAATLTQPAVLATSAAMSAQVSCNGLSDGAANATVTGGTTAYTYLWNTGATTATVSGLPAGTYSVTVTDAHGCTAASSATVTQPAVLVTSAYVNTVISCNGLSNGSVATSTTGGTFPYSYLWNTGATSASVSGLSVGTYSVTVTDGHGCTATSSITLTQPAALSASASTTTNACFGSSNGAVTSSATGGTPSYSYLWSNGATTSSATGLVAGTYTVTVTDTRGCTASSATTVTQPAAPITNIVTVGTNVSCNGGTNGAISTAVSGGTPGYSYLWSNGAITSSISGLTAGTYTVTVTDAAGCSKTNTATVTQPSAIVFNTTGTNVSCNGGANGAIAASASGGTPGYTYLWSNGATTAGISGLVAGVYTYTVTDAASCSITAPVTITQPPVLTLSAVATPNPICPGDNLFLNATPAGGSGVYTSFSWSGPNTFASSVQNASIMGISGAVAGVYSVTVTDNSGCPSVTATTAAVTVTMLSTPISGAMTVCHGMTTTLTDAIPGGTWSSSSGVAAINSLTGVVTGIAPGTATITYKVGPVCYLTATVSVNPFPSGIIITGGLCEAGTMTVTNGTPGGTWSSNNTAIATVDPMTGIMTGVSGGSVKISYTAGGCAVTTFVTVDPLPTIVPITGTTTFCEASSSALLNANVGGVWSTTNSAVATVGGLGLVIGIAPGTATISYALTNSCGTRASTTTVTIMPLPHAGTLSGASAICIGSTTTLASTVTGGVWTSDAPSIATVNSASGLVTGLAGGVAHISYSFTNSCGTDVVVTPITIDVLSASISGPDSVSIGQYITMTGLNPGGTWSISNSSVATTGCAGQLFGVAPGTTSITYTITNTCGTISATASLTVIDASCTVPYIYTIAGNGAKSFGGDGGAATSASISNPLDVAVDITGNVYIADKDNNRIRKVTPAGVISTFAGNGSAGFSGDGGPATAARLNGPSGVGVDLNGNVYIADYNNDRVRIVNPSGVISTFAGNGSTGYSGDGGYALAATFNKPIDVVSDINGNIYIVDFNNSAIRKVAPSGIVTTVAGNGVSGFSGDGGPATAAMLYHPTQMDVDCNGNIFIDDENNVRIRKVTVTTGVITTIAGIGIDGDAGDGGPATAAILNQPYGVAVDAWGNVIIADRANTRVRIVDPAGIIHAYAGTHVRGFSGDNGPAVNGQLYLPYGIAVDGNGSLYIADNINQRIRKVTYPILLPITGTTEVCAASTRTLSDGTTGGTWSSSNTAVATVNSGTGVVTGVSAGTVTITYKLGTSCRATTSFTVHPLPILSVASITHVSCFGVSDGAITTTTTSGTPAFTYLWTPGGATTTGISSMPAGTYSLTVTDVHTCTARVTPTITQPALLVTNASVSAHVSCFGVSDGRVATATTGGTTPYTYLWSNGATTASVTGLAAGTYSVTVTDAHGCTATSATTITQPALLVTTAVTSANVSCFGLSNGSVFSSTAGGTTPYTFLWSSGATTSTVSGLIANTYSLTVTDAHGCTATGATTVTQPSVLATAASVIANVTCSGLSNGNVITVTTGGTTSYTYLWSNGATTANVSGLAAGTYSVTATDAHGCKATSSTTVTQPAVLATTASVSAHVSCFGLSDGSVSTSTTGGTTAYTYLWSNGATTSTISGLAAGTYSVTVTDANGCTAAGSATVTQPVVLATTATTTANVSCFGLSDGIVNNVATGGTTAYNYLWSNGATTASASGLAAGTYTVTVTDAHGCTTTGTATVTQPVVLATAASMSAQVSCFGLSTGSATTTTTGGTAAYTYLWSNGATTASVSGLAAGTYSVTVTDAHNCTATSTAVVTQPAVLAASVSTANNVSCFGLSNGGVSVSATGGTTAYTYLWSNGATTASVSSLPAGTYSVTVTDAHGCTAAGSTTVTQPPVFTTSASASANVTCFGLSNGSVTTSVAGGTAAYTYLWNNGATTASVSGLTAATYTVVATDAHGCTATSTATVTQPALLAVTPSATDVTCFGLSNGSINTTVTGGTTAYSYLWNTGATSASVSGLTAATYTVTVTDANGCTTTGTPTVAQPAVLAVVLAPVNITCFGLTNGSIATSVTGGTASFSYLWSNGATTATLGSLAIGTYSVTVTDSKGCTAVNNAAITQPPVLLVTASAAPNPICEGDNVVLTSVPSGGTGTYVTFGWNGPASFAANVQNTGVTGITSGGAGVYSVTVTDNNGCSATGVTTSVTVNPLPTAINVEGDGILCAAFTLSLSDATIGGAWTSSNTSVATVGSTSSTDATVTAVSVGTATITYALGSGCFVTANVTVAPTCLGSGLRQPGPIHTAPNPTTGDLVIDWENQQVGTSAQVMLYDVVGRKVYESTLNFTQATGAIQINIDDLIDGTYILSVVNSTVNYSSKILKVQH